jgi:hypothetical protein
MKRAKPKDLDDLAVRTVVRCVHLVANSLKPHAASGGLLGEVHEPGFHLMVTRFEDEFQVEVWGADGKVALVRLRDNNTFQRPRFIVGRWLLNLFDLDEIPEQLHDRVLNTNKEIVAA